MLPQGIRDEDVEQTFLCPLPLAVIIDVTDMERLLNCKASCVPIIKGSENLNSFISYFFEKSQTWKDFSIVRRHAFQLLRALQI